MKDYGSVTHRKDGYSYGRISVNGQKKEFYVKDKVGDFVISDYECQRKLNDFAMSVLYGNLQQGNVLSFYDFTMSYIYTYKYGIIKADSYDRLERTALHFKDSILDVSVWKIDDVRCQRYLNSIACKYSKSSIKKDFDLIRAVLSYAYRKKLIEFDYAGMLVLPTSEIDSKEIEIYSNDECDKLIHGIESVMQNPDWKERKLFRYAPAYILLLNTGLRAGELLSLTFSDVDFDDAIMHVHFTLSYVKDRSADADKRYISLVTSNKTVNSVRAVPLNDVAIDCLKYLKRQSTCEYFVDNGKGEHLTYSTFVQRYKRICNYLDVPYKGLHALRHTFASRLIKGGISPKVVSDLLGHSSVVFTLNRYVHTDIDSRKNAVNVLAAVKSEVCGNCVEMCVEDKNKHPQTLENTCFIEQQPIGESNPCFRRERAAS